MYLIPLLSRKALVHLFNKLDRGSLNEGRKLSETIIELHKRRYINSNKTYQNTRPYCYCVLMSKCLTGKVHREREKDQSPAQEAKRGSDQKRHSTKTLYQIVYAKKNLSSCTGHNHVHTVIKNGSLRRKFCVVSTRPRGDTIIFIS